MGYSAGYLNKRITILNRKAAEAGRYGLDSAGIEWEEGSTVWAAVTWQKGKSALSAGAIDSYGLVQVCMRYEGVNISMRSRIVHDNVTYQIIPETFHSDYRENTITFLAQAIVE